MWACSINSHSRAHLSLSKSAFMVCNAPPIRTKITFAFLPTHPGESMRKTYKRTLALIPARFFTSRERVSDGDSCDHSSSEFAGASKRCLRFDVSLSIAGRATQSPSPPVSPRSVVSSCFREPNERPTQCSFEVEQMCRCPYFRVGGPGTRSDHGGSHLCGRRQETERSRAVSSHS